MKLMERLRSSDTNDSVLFFLVPSIISPFPPGAMKKPAGLCSLLSSDDELNKSIIHSMVDCVAFGARGQGGRNQAVARVRG